MNAENIQQEHIYNEHIQDFSSLLTKIKADTNLSFLLHFLAKDEAIYNAVVGSYIVKSLIEYGASGNKSANWNKEVYEVLQNELYKMKKAEQQLEDEAKQQLESEVQKRLKDYIEGGVEDVSIYGNHASITLEDNKKEFKISEFLNSDFCQNNGISGFSTLHSDGTSGMHGFVAEEKGRKIRHYVVTDGSYEMTLNWYDTDKKKCTIKINIDKDGIDLVERNGVTDDQLKANKDVKIGGLFLHQIQFREKGQEKEVQHGKGGNQVQHEAYETVVRSNGRNIGQDIGVESSRKRRLSYDSGIEEDFNNKIYSQKVKKKRERRQAAREENLGDKIYNLQLLFEENSQNKKTPPPPPHRISPLNKDISDKKRDLDHQNDGQRNEQKKLTPKVQQQEKGGDLFQDIRNFKKNNLQHVDGRKALIEKSDKNDSSIDIKTNDSGYSSPITDQSQFQVDPKSLTRKLEALNHKKEDKLSGEYGKNSKDHDTEKNIPKDPLSENILQKIKEDKPIYKWLKDKIEGKEGNQNLDALEEKLSQKSGQGNIVEKRENDGGKPLSADGNEEVWYDALEDLTGLDEDEYFDAVEDLNEQKINQSTNLADQVIDKQEVEHNSDRSTSPVSVDENTNVEQSSDTQQESSHRSDVDNKLESAQPTNPADRVMDELREVLKKPDKGLKKPAQQVTEKNIPKDPFSENILEKIQEGKQYDPIRKFLKNKIDGQNNIITAATELRDAFFELCTEAQKGFAKRRRINQPWAKHVVESQRKKDENNGTNINRG